MEEHNDKCQVIPTLDGYAVCLFAHKEFGKKISASSERFPPKPVETSLFGSLGAKKMKGFIILKSEVCLTKYYQ